MALSLCGARMFRSSDEIDGIFQIVSVLFSAAFIQITIKVEWQKIVPPFFW